HSCTMWDKFLLLFSSTYRLFFMYAPGHLSLTACPIPLSSPPQWLKKGRIILLVISFFSSQAARGGAIVPHQLGEPTKTMSYPPAFSVMGSSAGSFPDLFSSLTCFKRQSKSAG